MKSFGSFFAVICCSLVSYWCLIGVASCQVEVNWHPQNSPLISLFHYSFLYFITHFFISLLISSNIIYYCILLYIIVYYCILLYIIVYYYILLYTPPYNFYIRQFLYTGPSLQVLFIFYLIVVGRGLRILS